MYFDTHIHLNNEKYIEDFDKMYNEMLEFGCKYFVCPGYDIKSSKKALELSDKYNEIYAMVGIHPSEAEEYKDNEKLEEDLKIIKEFSKNKKVVGIGEIGLDYYWTKETILEQKELFIKQIELANELNLPISIHIREATIDVLEILENYDKRKKGIFHCVSLNEHLIKEGVKLRLLYFICW